MTVPESRTGLLAAMVVVAVVGAAAALPGVFVRATYGAQLSGDEPHYLLTAISLIEDGDLDLHDEFGDQRYRPFHESGLSPQGSEATDERIVAPHDPLLPALLAVPWRLGGWQAAKAALVALNAALGALLVWTAVRRFAVRPSVAGIVAGLFVASAPLAVYGSQLYPELPAALAVTVALAAGLDEPRATTVAAVVAAVIALPWLAVKYAPVALVLTAVLLVRWWRAGHARSVLAAVGAFVVAGAAFALAHLAWYGGLTPYAASDFFHDRGGQLSVIGTRPDYLGRSRRLLGLLVDEQFGLASWQPAYLLVVPAAASMLRGRPRGWAAVLAPLAAGWLSASLLALTMHGWWFPGRQTVVVLPLAIVAVAWLCDRSRGGLTVAVGAATAGVVAWGWLLADGLRGRVTLIVDFAAAGNPIHEAWRTVLPNYLDVTVRTWVLHGMWGAVALALAWLGWEAGSGARGGARAASGARPTPGSGSGAASRAGALAVEVADRRTVVLAAGGEGEAGSEGESDESGSAHGLGSGGWGSEDRG